MIRTGLSLALMTLLTVVSDAADPAADRFPAPGNLIPSSKADSDVMVPPEPTPASEPIVDSAPMKATPSPRSDSEVVPQSSDIQSLSPMASDSPAYSLPYGMPLDSSMYSAVEPPLVSPQGYYVPYTGVGVNMVAPGMAFPHGYPGVPSFGPAPGLHARYPYYSYRRPWYTPGPASLNVNIIW